MLALASAWQEQEPRWLICSAALAGVSALARYPGVVYGLLGIGVTASVWAGQWSRRRASTFYGLVSLLPLATFLAWSVIVRGSGAPRALISGHLGEASLPALVQQVASQFWLWKPVPARAAVQVVFDLPDPLLVVIPLASLVLSGLGIILLVATRRLAGCRQLGRSDPGARRLAIVCLAFSVLYLGFMAGSYFLTYPTLDINSRTLLPILPALLLIMLGALVHLTAGRLVGARWGQVGAGVLLVSMVVSYLIPTFEMIAGLRRTGAGYTARAWQQSQIMQGLQDLPPDVDLISNEPEAALLYLNRYPHDLNTWAALYEAEAGTLSFGCGDTDLEKLFRLHGTRLILFNPTGWTGIGTERVERTSLTNLSLCNAGQIQNYADGSVHQSTAAGP